MLSSQSNPTDVSTIRKSQHHNPYQSTRNRKRAERRKRKLETNGHAASSVTIFEHVQLADAVDLSYNASSMPANRGAFSAKFLAESQAERERPYSLQELKEMGFTVVEWDGIEPVPLIDEEDRIIAILAGMPVDPGYLQAGKNVFARGLLASQQGNFSSDERQHRRGSFVSLPFGISYGSGQTVPQRLATGNHGALVKTLLEDVDLQRLANYADSAFQLWAPKLYSHYQECLSKVEQATGTSRNFRRCAFACANLNMGPQTIAIKHCDSLNAAYGLCSIQSLGEFDPKLGGHLILWDLSLVIEFPPYSTILIPSACLTHSNVPIQQDETRLSFTQYSAGGLFRWVSNACMTESALKAYDEVEYNKIMEKKSNRWKECLKLFSTYKELTLCL
ncbi:hypothetical protein BJ165DRAFT_642156 [Panaeolus papilionaceus]|nr:hypothetical protein BJ165DRAFT_642156 [Panaeolus papilionaceus]